MSFDPMENPTHTSAESHPPTNTGGSRRESADQGGPSAPLVSIVVVVFRDRAELAALLDNIVPFRRPEVELIVIDGGSADGTLDLLAARDLEIDLWLSEPDRGIYDAMNKGISRARGMYILHLNAGDRLLSLPLALLRDCARRNIDVITCRVLEDGSRIFAPRSAWSMRLYNTWHHQGTFFRRAANLHYDCTYKVFGDFEQNQRLLRGGCSVEISNRIIAEHSSGGASANPAMMREMYRAIRKNFGPLYVPLAMARVRISALLRRLPGAKPADAIIGARSTPATTPKPGTVSVVVVTHNSELFLASLFESLETQTLPPALVVVVDSGSSDTAYLDRARQSPLPCRVVLEKNVGFAEGSNIGWRLARGCEFVLFLNPDAFLTPEYLERAVEFMQADEQQTTGIVTGNLLGYDIAVGEPTGLLDSTGIQRTWYGRYYDRDQGVPVSEVSRYGVAPNPVLAICGAAMLARETALRSIAVNDSVFRADFFMYKEDIDLSLKMRRAGWTLIHHPGMNLYHCRGWKKREAVSRELRLMAARNEVKMNLAHRSPFVLFSALKYALIRIADL